MSVTGLSLLYFLLTSCKLGFTVVPSSVLDNLIEGLTELTYVLYLLLAIYYKGYNPLTKKRDIGKYVGKSGLSSGNTLSAS